MSQPLAGRAIPTNNANSSKDKMVQKTMGRLRIRLNRARNLKVRPVSLPGGPLHTYIPIP